MFGQQPGQTGADEYGVYGGAAGGYPGGAMAAGAAMAPGDETSTSPGPTYLPTVPPTNLGGPALMSGLPFTSQELLYYQQLYSMADAENKGYVQGISAVNVLGKSGLPQQLLSSIWSIADADNQGFLTPERFCVALRLVAHAQAGRPPSPELCMSEPPALPEFEGLQRKRGDSELSPVSGVGRRSELGNMSDISDLQPVIVGAEEQVRKAAEFARQASPSPQPRPFDRSRWAPTQREKRKYASLFLRTDWDNDGFVEANQAKPLVERSRLDNETLATVWEHSDRDHDGRLTFVEFVALIHIISCLKKGAVLPGLQEGLPPELLGALRNITETPEELSAQRSRSTSPRPSGAASPAYFFSGSPVQMSPTPAEAALGQADAQASPGPWAAEPFAGPAFPVEGEPGETAQFGDAPADGFAAFNDAGQWPTEDPGHQGKKEKKKKKDKTGDFGPPADGFGDPSAGAFGSTFSQPDGFAPAMSSTFEPPQDVNYGRMFRDLSPSRREEADSVGQHFEAVLQADRAVSQQVHTEVGVLEGELRQVTEQRDQLQAQVKQELQKAESFGEQRQQLERTLQEAKLHLKSLCEGRRGMNLESISLRRDREHVDQELAFLSRMASEEENTLEAVLKSNHYLEKSCRSLEGQTESLERTRRDLAKEVGRERDEIRQAERRNAEMRNQLDRLRREQVAAVQSRQEEHLREQRLNAMQNIGPFFGRLMPERRVADERSMAVGAHSWAHTLAASGSATASSGDRSRPLGSRELGTAALAPAMAAQRVGSPLGGAAPSSVLERPAQLVAAGPRNREGV